jgi:protein TonB
MPAATLSLPTLPRADRRLLVGVALSALAHIALIAGVRPMVAAYAPVGPLEVRISHVSPLPEILFASSAASEIAAANTGSQMSDPPETGPAAIAPGDAARSGTGPVPVPGPDLMLRPDQYYTSREVDVRAEPLNDPPLVYPELAYQRRIKGRVTLQIFINERGGIDQLSVVHAEPRGVFEAAALSAMDALQFSAAMKDGRHVKSQKTIEVTFDPYESIHIP